ncbi:MAG: phage shock protein PspA [Verrucomicrobia bacterium]|jgi:phage shock protein A|nr:phage shock protein PspA [Verrucomicrobiota bacterium]
MGIFSRFRDIVGSNINAMLEKAEDPEKLIKLMIQEMEDTLVELKASCAGAMASRTRVERARETAATRARQWDRKARLAVEKGREDLAREALLEKRASAEEAEARRAEVDHFDDLVSQYQKDIQQLEDKLQTARNKHRILVQRHIHAGQRKTAQTRIRNADHNDAFVRFEQFENRIDRMEADADLVNYRGSSLEDEFSKLETDEEIERELENLKKGGSPDGSGKQES